jgi:hypothetical protein
MDCLHREVQPMETRTGRNCQFCQRSDPEFGNRHPLDRLACSELNDTAAAHMTENGHIKHRLLEVRVRIVVAESRLANVA